MRTKSVLTAALTLMAVSCGLIPNESKQKSESENLSFSELSEAFVEEGSFTASEILANVSGNKEGYSVKEIKNISDTAVARLGKDQTSINFVRSGALTASLIFEHHSKADAVIDDAKFKILGEREFSFNLLRKSFVKGGSFTETEIFANVSGNKEGYHLKEIQDISDTSVAQLAIDTKSINFVRIGSFSATLVLEHELKTDVTIKHAKFRIVDANQQKPLTYPTTSKYRKTLMKTFEDGGYFSNLEIQHHFVGNGFLIQKIKDISDTSVAKLDTSQENILFLKPGRFTATLVLMNHYGVAEYEIKNAPFYIKPQRRRFSHPWRRFYP